MKYSLVLLICFALAGFLTSCGSKDQADSGDTVVITEKIEYPVFIKNPYGEDQMDWWKENIETSKRIDFVQTLFDWAYAGEVSTFDYLTNEPLTAEQVKAIGNERDTIRITSPVPPYEEKDTVIQNKIDLRLVHKIKFLEEWQFNMKDHSISKKLLGIAPTLTEYEDSLDIKGYRPLFWIYFDEDYIQKLSKKEK